MNHLVICSGGRYDLRSALRALEWAVRRCGDAGELLAVEGGVSLAVWIRGRIESGERRGEGVEIGAVAKAVKAIRVDTPPSLYFDRFQLWNARCSLTNSCAAANCFVDR
jgi:hypothetical protein